MSQPREGKRRASLGAADLESAAPAELARMWASLSQAQTVLGKRRLYYLASGAEERIADQLSLVGMLQDWVPVTTIEAAVLLASLRAYVGTEIESPRDHEAEALRTCIRAMTLSRARSSVPFPRGDELDDALIG